MNLTDPTVITFGIYLLAMLLIGWMGYRSTSDLSDYILGGRSLGSVVTALSAGASDMSGWLLMGLPGAVYLSGISGSWIAIGLIVGAYLNWRFVAGRLRLYTERAGNALTLPDFFASRFEDRSQLLRILTALVILVFFTMYCASGVVAGARLFENMFGLPYVTSLWVGAACTIAYVFIGGFLAVSWTDTIQASLMITALILAPVVGYFAVVGGLQPHESLTQMIAPEKLDLFLDASFVGIVSLLAWGARLLRAAAHPGAFHGGRVGQGHPGRTAYRHDLDDSLSGWLHCRRFYRHPLFRRASGERRPGERQCRNRVHRNCQTAF